MAKVIKKIMGTVQNITILKGMAITTTMDIINVVLITIMTITEAISIQPTL
jgi:hypothetical protein